MDFPVIYEFHVTLKGMWVEISLFFWATYNDVCLVKCNSEAQFYKDGHKSKPQFFKK